MKTIPNEVALAAKDLIADYGPRLEYLGQYGKSEAYEFAFPEDVVTGFPFVFLYKDGQVTPVTGPDALRISVLFASEVE